MCIHVCMSLSMCVCACLGVSVRFACPVSQICSFSEINEKWHHISKYLQYVCVCMLCVCMCLCVCVFKWQTASAGIDTACPSAALTGSPW